MKLLKLNPKSYVLSCIDPSQMTATEALFFVINNILVFEETVFTQLPAVVDRFKQVLDQHDRDWLHTFFHKQVYVQQSGSIKFDTDLAIYFKCILEILLECKYGPRESGYPELPIPPLPDEVDVAQLDPLYTRYAPTRIKHYHEVAQKYLSHNE